MLKRYNRSWTILISSHGDPDTCGVSIGSNGSASGHEPRLVTEHIYSVLLRSVNASMFMTSAYSGGWLVQLNFNSGRSLLSPDYSEERAWSF